MKKSILVNKNIKAVNREYLNSSKLSSEFQKVKWGSKVSMINRFKLAIKILKNQSIDKWLDVGSGTGLFFVISDKFDFNTKDRCGVELNKNLYNFSKKKKYKINTKFINKDIIRINDNSKYDLITLIGTLQNCGHDPFFFLKKIITKIKKNGLIFLTSKNLNWHEFKKKNLLPEKSHSWFNTQDIALFLKKNGIKILKKKGFVPKDGRIVKEELSHTFFILGKKIN
tara:strand:+ start:7675 stop:8352 length:678 start_codon:yes stop_codon:yes gene_type:complete